MPLPGSSLVPPAQMKDWSSAKYWSLVASLRASYQARQVSDACEIFFFCRFDGYQCIMIKDMLALKNNETCNLRTFPDKHHHRQDRAQLASLVSRMIHYTCPCPSQWQNRIFVCNYGDHENIGFHYLMSITPPAKPPKLDGFSCVVGLFKLGDQQLPYCLSLFF